MTEPRYCIANIARFSAIDFALRGAFFVSSVRFISVNISSNFSSTYTSVRLIITLHTYTEIFINIEIYYIDLAITITVFGVCHFPKFCEEHTLFKADKDVNDNRHRNLGRLDATLLMDINTIYFHVCHEFMYGSD